MLKIAATRFIQLGEKISDIRTVLYMADTVSGDDPEDELNNEEREEMRENLIKLFDLCIELEMPISGDLISARFEQSSGTAKLPKTEPEYQILVDAVMAEIKNKYLLFIPSLRAQFYENDKFLDDETRVSFPLATAEMREAGNSFAAGLNTACVFHCMRALEHGLGALASELGKQFDVQN